MIQARRILFPLWALVLSAAFAVTIYNPDVAIPSVSHWGLALCAGLLLAIGIWGLPKRRSAS